MGRHIDQSLPEFLRDVSRPAVLTPAGGSVIGVVGALAASLSILAVQVSTHVQPQTHLPKPEPASSGFDFAKMSLQLEELRTKLMNTAEEDIYDAARQMQKSNTQRAHSYAPAKMAKLFLQMLQLFRDFKPFCSGKVASDLRVATHLTRAAVLAISEIEWDNAQSEQANPAAFQQIQIWRDDALQIAGILLEGHTI